MPKIIENLRESILSEALNIIDEEGADRLNIRHISSRLGIAPSTIYNYYSSKEHIVGELAVMRWNEAMECTDRMTEGLSVIERLSVFTEELKRQVKPVLLVHISAVLKENEEERSTDHLGILFTQLEDKVRSITGISDDHDIKVIAKLITACMHDDELDVADIARVMKLI